MKRRQELEDICCRTHIQPDPSTASDKANAMIDSGMMVASSMGCTFFSISLQVNELEIIYVGLLDPCELLANIETQINQAKDEAFIRKDIMDRIERWLSACEEEKWLEDYNRVSYRILTQNNFSNMGLLLRYWLSFKSNSKVSIRISGALTCA